MFTTPPPAKAASDVEGPCRAKAEGGKSADHDTWTEPRLAEVVGAAIGCARHVDHAERDGRVDQPRDVVVRVGQPEADQRRELPEPDLALMRRGIADRGAELGGEGQGRLTQERRSVGEQGDRGVFIGPGRERGRRGK